MAEAAHTPRGWELSSTCRGMQTTAEANGKKLGLAEAGANTLAPVLIVQARRKFGADDPAGKQLLDALAAAAAVEHLQQLGESLLAAADWSTWLAGIEAPAPAAKDIPELAPDDIDLEPEQPCIEVTAKVGTVAGQTLILQLRLQKWYQPDLGEILYHEARRLEKRHKFPPLMAVILMWPSADGPAITGRYRATDKKGRKIDFRYEVRRAWEMRPEEALASPGTLVLLPLSKGAKERMPELLRLMKARLDEFKPEPRTLQAIWAAFYWGVGMACTLEEAHTMLGDLLPMIQDTPDYKKAYNSAFRTGYAQGLKEGPIQALRALIRQQATRRFGDDPASVAALEANGSLQALKSIAAQVPTAAGWSELLASTATPG